MAGETTLTTLSESVLSYIISAAIGGALTIPLTYNLISYIKDLSQDPTSTWRSIVRDDITDAVSVAEADDVTDASMTDSKVDISVSTIARSVLVTYEVANTTPFNEIVQATFQVTGAVRRKIDALMLTDTTPNLTKESGDNSTTMTYAQFVSFLMEAQAQWKDNPPLGSVLRAVLHSGPFQAMVNDMMTTQTSIFASTFGAVSAAQVLNAMGNGGMKNIAGVDTLISDRVPVADTTGKGNIFTLVGGEAGSALGIAVKWGVQGEMRATEKKLANRMIAHARIGCGVVRDDYALKAITAAA
jgi:hypothetical protein